MAMTQTALQLTATTTSTRPEMQRRSGKHVRVYGVIDAFGPVVTRDGKRVRPVGMNGATELISNVLLADHTWLQLDPDDPTFEAFWNKLKRGDTVAFTARVTEYLKANGGTKVLEYSFTDIQRPERSDGFDGVPYGKPMPLPSIVPAIDASLAVSIAGADDSGDGDRLAAALSAMETVHATDVALGTAYAIARARPATDSRQQASLVDIEAEISRLNLDDFRGLEVFMEREHARRKGEAIEAARAKVRAVLVEEAQLARVDAEEIGTFVATR